MKLKIKKAKTLLKRKVDTLKTRAVVLLTGLFFSAQESVVLAAPNASANQAFSEAADQIRGYASGTAQVIYAIAAVIAIVSAFQIYFKFQNGDQDVKKQIVMTVGGCIALCALAAFLPEFFSESNASQVVK